MAEARACTRASRWWAPCQRDGEDEDDEEVEDDDDDDVVPGPSPSNWPRLARSAAPRTPSPVTAPLLRRMFFPSGMQLSVVVQKSREGCNKSNIYTYNK